MGGRPECDRGLVNQKLSLSIRWSLARRSWPSDRRFADHGRAADLRHRLETLCFGFAAALRAMDYELALACQDGDR
jgi:hypothetical protein